MSQADHDIGAPAAFGPPPTNGLAIAGFICALLGLESGGVLSPVGLILSLVALGREPRGFAIAGVILGLLGTCAGLIALLFFGAAILGILGLGAAATVLALSEPEKTELFADSIAITRAIETHRAANDRLPESLDELNFHSRAVLVDPWGNAYRYVHDPGSGTYGLFSNGPDGLPGTEDDQDLRDVRAIWEDGTSTGAPTTENVPPTPGDP